jgi:TolB-like protein
LSAGIVESAQANEAGAVVAFSRRISSAADPIVSVAALPVTNVASDSATRGIADGVTDLLIDRLSRVRQLRAVALRTSVMRYAGTRKSAREIGEELGVDRLVDVSVFRDDQRARVTADLILVAKEQLVWSQRFDGAMRDVRALGREVAEAVAQEVQRARSGDGGSGARNLHSTARTSARRITRIDHQPDSSR